MSKRCKLWDDFQEPLSSMRHKLARFLVRESVDAAEIRMRPVCEVVLHIEHELPDLEPAQYVDAAFHVRELHGVVAQIVEDHPIGYTRPVDDLHRGNFTRQR